MYSISTIVEKLRKGSIATVIPVVFICAAAVAQLFNFGQGPARAFGQERSSLGGPAALAATDALFDGAAMLTSELRLAAGLPIADDPDKVAGFLIADAALVLGRETGNGVLTRDGLLIYKVTSGDTLSRIAAEFGISVDTIISANPTATSRLKIGQELAILPVQGALHVVEDGDTLDSIASRYAVPPDVITAANPGLTLAPGSRVIVPGAKITRKSLASAANALPDLGSYFAVPAKGWNWGKIHGNNGVDIANACGTPILASAEGLAVTVESGGEWNGGYGNEIVLEHPNGKRTRYAHNQDNLIAVGDYVNQGQQIATMGNNGNSTGCHLHFEVHNAKNPLARY